METLDATPDPANQLRLLKTAQKIIRMIVKLLWVGCLLFEKQLYTPNPNPVADATSCIISLEVSISPRSDRGAIIGTLNCHSYPGNWESRFSDNGRLLLGKEGLALNHRNTPWLVLSSSDVYYISLVVQWGSAVL